MQFVYGFTNSSNQTFIYFRQVIWFYCKVYRITFIELARSHTFIIANTIILFSFYLVFWRPAIKRIYSREDQHYASWSNLLRSPEPVIVKRDGGREIGQVNGQLTYKMYVWRKKGEKDKKVNEKRCKILWTSAEILSLKSEFGTGKGPIPAKLHQQFILRCAC